MAATAVARVAFAADCGGSSSSTSPKVAAAINAAFGRFATPAQTWLCIGGDEYDWASAKTMKNYDVFLNAAHVSAARTVMTPGNHSNGPAGSTTKGDASAWLAYNASKGTLTRTTGGWINQSAGMPLTDQFVDIGGIRFIFINSGGVANAKPGWPVPVTGGSVAGNARVDWLRSAWKPGLANVVVTHHPRWSVYGGNFDNPAMQNLIDEILGRNDGSGPHSRLILQGHDHNMQLMKPQLASGSYKGLVSVVAGLCATAPGTAAAGSANTSKKSWLQFLNMTPAAKGFLQVDVMSDRSLQLSMIQAADTTGTLMKNTSGTGITGAAKVTIATA